MKNSMLMTRTGLLIVIALALALIALTNQLLTGARVDLTENQLYTLSDGTKNILNNIEEPINLYFFHNSEAAQGIPTLNSYAQRVGELLEELSQHAGGKLNLTVIDPQPFSEEEDRAVELGVQPVPVGNGDNLYFGLAATNALDDNEVIPFFQPQREELLEYDLAKMIFQLNQTNKPVVGMMSELPVDGGFDQRRMQPGPKWQIVSFLEQFFEVKPIDKNATSIPDDVDMLILIHPSSMLDETYYAIDQFALRGGNILMFIDPYSEIAAGSVRDMVSDPIMPRSHPEKLLSAWGIDMTPDHVLGDARYALSITMEATRPPIYHLALLGLETDAINQDDVITRGMEAINLAFAGSIRPRDGATTEFTPLLSTSEESMPMPANLMQPGMDPASLHQGFKRGGEPLTIAARVTGPAMSAFPDGAPETATPVAAESDAKPAEHLAESTGNINVVVVADTDLLSDRLWVQVQNFFGQRIAQPWANNGDLVINAVDNLLGSSDLISIRSRASFTRPFERVEALKRDADASFRAKERELQDRLSDTERKLAELQSQKGDDGSAMILSPEQQATLEGFQQDRVRFRKQLREVRHELDRSIERLGTVLKFINIGLVPLLLTLFVLIFAVGRSARTGRS